MSTLITTAPPQTHAEALTRRAVFLIGVAMLVLVGVLAMTAFSGADRSGPLAWSGKAELFTHPTLPGDRVFTGTLRNDGLHTMRVDLGDVRMLDGDGKVVPSNPVFLQTFGKTLWAAGRGPETVPDTERQRTVRMGVFPTLLHWR